MTPIAEKIIFTTKLKSEKMQGTIPVTKADGVKLLEKKYNVTYHASFTSEPEDILKDLHKTVEDKIKNLALIAEKFPIDSGMFVQMLRQQLSAEVGKFGIRLTDISLEAHEVVPEEQE